MNKSKFLKKSLAALLAVMLVVAMVPLSALAADVSEVPQVRVGTVGASKETTFSGDTYKVDISTLDRIVLGWSEPEGWAANGGKSMYVDFFKVGTETQVAPWSDSQKVQTDPIAYLPNVADKTGENEYTIDVRTTTQFEDGSDDKVETFKLVMTLKESSAQMDPTIAATYIDGVTSSIGQDTITLSMGFGYTLPSDLEVAPGGALASGGSYQGDVDDAAPQTNFNNLKHWFTPADPDGIYSIEWKHTAGATNPYSLTVVTKQHVTKTYTIVQTWEKGFTGFTVPDQIGDSRITMDGKNISIDVPATYKFGDLIVPTFTLDAKQGTVKNGQPMGTSTPVPIDKLTIESGKTGLKFTDNYDGTATFDLNVHTAADPSHITKVTVTLNKQLFSTNELKSVKFEKNNTAYAGSVETPVVEGSTTNVKVQAGTVLKDEVTPANGAVNLSLTVIASENATVSIPAQQNVAAAKAIGTASGLFAGDNLKTATLTGVDASNGPIRIRVSPEDGSASKEYVVNLVVDQTEAQLNSFVIKNGSGDVFRGVLTGDKTFVIKVPYDKGHFKAVSGTAPNKNGEGLANYDVFATCTAGAKINFPEYVSLFGTGVSSLTGNYTVADVFYNQTTTTWVKPGEDLKVQVVQGTAAPVDWKVRIEVERPSVGHTMQASGNVVVGTKNLGLVDGDNTYENVTVGKDVDKNGRQINTIKVEVPFSFNAGYLSFKDWKLSENAILAQSVDNTQSSAATALGKVPTDNYDDMKDGKFIDLTSTPNNYGRPTAAQITSAVENDGRVDTSKTVKLFVINQSVWGNAPMSSGAVDTHPTLTVEPNGTLKNNGTAVDATNYTVYYLYCVKQAAKTDADLVTMESTTDKSVTARLNPVTKHVEITVPYSYNVQTASPTTPVKLFSLNFKLSDQATMFADAFQAAATPAPTRPHVSAVKVNSDKGTTATSDRTYFYVEAGQLKALKSGTAAAPAGLAMTNRPINAGDPANVEGYFVVQSESKTKTSEYPIDFRIDLEQTEAKLNSLKVAGVNGTIGALDANSKAIVTLELPVGTQLNEQTIDLAVSKMAKVTVNGFDYSADRKFDLSKDVTIKVVSEDKSKENTYILKTTLRQGFNDVHENDWFYSEVMEAVANGWIKGRGNGIFDPYGSMNRGDFALIIARMDKSFDATDSEGCPFPDVTGEEYQAAAKYVYEKGYMTGDPDGNFAPSRALNRQEAAKVMCIMNGLAEEAGETTYADNATISDWAKGYVKAATTAGIFKGEGEDFNPGRYLRRCEGAAILVRSAK